MSGMYVLGGIIAVLVFLVLRNNLRHKRAGDTGFFRSLSPWEEGKEIKPAVKQQFMFWGGVMAGISSAAITHQLDVMKTCRQVGNPLPETFNGYLVGMVMGSVAQGARFGVTLVLNATLQKKLDSWEKNFKKGSCAQVVVAFCFSMLAGGIGEMMTNPFGVIKNYQIANNVGIAAAAQSLYELGGIGRFFNGIGFGVFRKSAANGIMLQTIGHVKTFLKKASPDWLGKDSGKASLGFISGSLTGAFAEVMTNHPDQVKTMTQTGVPMMDALVIATKNPFRGALWAGIRKGAIRGINWGCLEIFMAMIENSYRKFRKMAASSTKTGDRVSEFTRETTPM
ncbi:unnamed protein product [Prorocentrum cordatum]|uniref:Mitochondrial carrier protein n=1 Tax=Prorocentrum cordatum TaxID=2364126 RepID=A0ABN9QA02_9DINO|nr:unnamed protein product [Polarella glacialis]